MSVLFISEKVDKSKQNGSAEGDDGMQGAKKGELV